MKQEMVSVFILSVTQNGWLCLVLWLAVFAAQVAIVAGAVVYVYSNVHAIRTGNDRTETEEAEFHRRYLDRMRRDEKTGNDEGA
jgi:hypothetical protein